MNQIKLYIGVAVLTVLALLYFYISYLQKEVKVLTENNAKLTVAVQVQKKTIQRIKANAVIAAKAQTALYSDFAEARKQASKLVRLLSKHDLKFLATRKPGLVQRKVNRAIESINDCISKLSRGIECK